MDDTAVHLAEAQRNVRSMLDLRRVEGAETAVDLPDCPMFLWGMRRGAVAVVFVKCLNKVAYDAVVAFCRPDPVDDDDDDDDGLDDFVVADDSNDAAIAQCIVVHRDKATPPAAKLLLAYPHVRMELFSLNEILDHPLEWIIQSEYRLLDPAEAKEVLDKTPAWQLSVIQTTDPVQRWYNTPIGSVYRTVERFGRLEPAVVYRVVQQPTN